MLIIQFNVGTYVLNLRDFHTLTIPFSIIARCAKWVSHAKILASCPHHSYVLHIQHLIDVHFLNALFWVFQEAHLHLKLVFLIAKLIAFGLHLQCNWIVSTTLLCLYRWYISSICVAAAPHRPVLLHVYRRFCTIVTLCKHTVKQLQICDATSQKQDIYIGLWCSNAATIWIKWVSL